jgi:hypothetical protein
LRSISPPKSGSRSPARSVATSPDRSRGRTPPLQPARSTYVPPSGLSRHAGQVPIVAPGLEHCWPELSPPLVRRCSRSPSSSRATF